MEKVRKTAAKLVDKLFDAVMAPKKDTWALVLEGGAMRCVFTSGFLDSIHENCKEQFDLIVGVSAGAACGASFAAGQRGRMQNIFLNYLTDNRFLDYSRAFKSSRSILDLSYAIREISTNHVPLNTDALQRSKMKVYAGLTDVERCESKYVLLDKDNAIDALIASCNIPFLSRQSVPFEGRRYLDGGLKDPIPVRKAIELGANKIVAVLTQPEGYRASPRTLMKALLNKLFGTSDMVEELIRHEHTIYNNSKIYVELFDSPDVELIVVVPTAGFKVDLLTRNKGLLLQGYAEGFIAGNEIWRKLSKFSDFSQIEEEKMFF